MCGRFALNENPKKFAEHFKLPAMWNCCLCGISHRQLEYSWRIVSNITITRPPIRMLSTSFNGWHSIGVWVQGGGIQHGYEVELSFDSKTYPRNPTVSPSKRLGKETTGEEVITSTKEALPMW